MSTLNRKLYQMLQKATNKNTATIDRVIGCERDVILRLEIRDKFEDWIIKESLAEQTAQPYLRSFGFLEKGKRIEVGRWYRPCEEDDEEEIAEEFDIAANAFVEQWFFTDTAEEEG